MLDINLQTPHDLRLIIAQRAKAQRLALNLSQQELAERSGVSLGSVKRFESTGHISLKSLLEIALVLSAMPAFDALFVQETAPRSLFAPEPKIRKRSGKKRMLS